MPIWFFTPIKMKLLSICLRIYAKCFKCVIQLSLVSKIWFPKYMVIVFYAIKKCFAIYVGLQIISKWDTDAICAWPCPLSKKKNTNTQSTLVNSSGYFQYEISFHKVSINQTLLHFCEKRIEHFGNHTSSLTFDKLSSEVNLFDIPNDRKIGAKIEKRKKKWNYLPIM